MLRLVRLRGMRPCVRIAAPPQETIPCRLCQPDSRHLRRRHRLRTHVPRMPNRSRTQAGVLTSEGRTQRAEAAARRVRANPETAGDRIARSVPVAEEAAARSPACVFPLETAPP